MIYALMSFDIWIILLVILIAFSSSIFYEDKTPKPITDQGSVLDHNFDPNLDSIQNNETHYFEIRSYGISPI